jgi:hypothetical protein
MVFTREVLKDQVHLLKSFLAAHTFPRNFKHP